MAQALYRNHPVLDHLFFGLIVFFALLSAGCSRSEPAKESTARSPTTDKPLSDSGATPKKLETGMEVLHAMANAYRHADSYSDK
ncbi:MAG: hypothetical protein ACWGMZ_11430, partial [Thermoguttaceae bacterium]